HRHQQVLELRELRLERDCSLPPWQVRREQAIDFGAEGEVPGRVDDCERRQCAGCKAYGECTPSAAVDQPHEQGLEVYQAEVPQLWSGFPAKARQELPRSPAYMAMAAARPIVPRSSCAGCPTGPDRPLSRAIRASPNAAQPPG